MSERDVFKDGWFQEQLFAPTVAEAHLIIGVVPDSDHGQVQIEIRDPMSGILIALKSWPHVPLFNTRRTTMAALVDLLDALEDKELLPVPFPDRPADAG